MGVRRFHFGAASLSPFAVAAAALALSWPAGLSAADGALVSGDSASAPAVAASIGLSATGSTSIGEQPVRSAEAQGSAPCAARDPEDGKCYSSADAADLAWIGRGRTPSPSTPTGSASSRSRRAPLRDEDLPLEADPDDEAAREDGLLAAVAPGTSKATAQDVLNSQKTWSVWQRIIGSVSSFVVRKSDGHPVSVPEKELEALFSAGFPIPIENFSVAKFRDTFLAPRGRHRHHHAIDLAANHGVPVVAVVDGYIDRLGRDPRGGKVAYLRDNSGKFLFYYAHLAAHEPSLRVGDRVKKGERLGFVGSTGHVIGGPHLHFAIFAVEGESNFKKGLAINPYVVFAPLLPR